MMFLFLALIVHVLKASYISLPIVAKHENGKTKIKSLKYMKMTNNDYIKLMTKFENNSFLSLIG